MKQQSATPERPNRKSLRLPDYDYSSKGAYFVTICLQDRQNWFEDEENRLILQQVWDSLPNRFQGITLDSFMIMPDHIHFILWLNPEPATRVSLGTTVGAYKSLTARAILEHMRAKGQPHQEKMWQRGYAERIIRNDAELQQKRTYIENNPIKDDLKHHRIQ